LLVSVSTKVVSKTDLTGIAGKLPQPDIAQV